jgi:hypothetical protein
MRRFLWPGLLLAALAVAFFGSLLLAAMAFPDGYAWYRTVISSLASPRQNPAAYRIASLGLAASGILLSLLGFQLRTSLKAHAPKWTAWARFFFVLGGMLLTISSLITPGHHAFLGLGKAHAKFAQAAGIGLGLGMALNLPALLRLPASRKWVRITAILLIVVPITSYLSCRILLLSGISTSVQQALEKSIFGRLSFWEWTGSVSAYLFVALIVLALRPKR